MRRLEAEAFFVGAGALGTLVAVPLSFETSDGRAADLVALGRSSGLPETQSPGLGLPALPAAARNLVQIGTRRTPAALGTDP